MPAPASSPATTRTGVDIPVTRVAPRTLSRAGTDMSLQANDAAAALSTTARYRPVDTACWLGPDPVLSSFGGQSRREDRRPLRDPRGARKRGHGHRLPRPPDRPRPHGRAQGAERPPPVGRVVHPALAARVAARRLAEPPQHRHGPRL